MANLVPKTNKSGSLGTSAKLWKEVHHVTASFDSGYLVEESSVLKVKTTPFLVEQNLTVLGDLDISSQSSSLDLNSQKISNLGSPASNTDAATKAYVDGVVQGLDIKESVKAASDGNNYALSTDLQAGDSIDGVLLSSGDRVLLKDQTDPIENGIYLVVASGDASNSRSLDLAAADSAAGSFVFVEEGTVNADAGFVCTSNGGSDVVGTNSLQFTQFSGAGQITAGSGLAKSGNELSVNVDGTSLEINTDDLRVKADGINNSHLHATVITGQTEATGVEADDLVLVYDDDASALRKMKRSTFVAGIGGAIKPNDLLVGDAAVDILTTTGEITLFPSGSGGSYEDIVFKVNTPNGHKEALRINAGVNGSSYFLKDINLSSDDSKIYFGTDNEIYLNHKHNSGLELGTSLNNDLMPVFSLKGTGASFNYGPELHIIHDKAVANSDILGRILFKGNSSATTNNPTTNYVGITCSVLDKTSGSDRGKITISPSNGSTQSNVGLSVKGTGTSSKILVDVETHNGSDAGLQLGGTLVTSTAAELNVLDYSVESPSDDDVLTFTTAQGLHWAAVSSGTASSISAGNTSVTATDTGSDGAITINTEGTDRWSFTSSGHLLPSTNADYDIGSAEKKVRHLFLSDNSLRFGSDGANTAPYVLSVDTTNHVLRFSSNTGSSHQSLLMNIVEDTTPQLGASLDVNGQDIVSVSNGNISLAPNGSGQVVIKGNTTGGSGQIKLNCEDNSHGITLKGPPHSAGASYTLVFPNALGSANNILQTDASGNLSWTGTPSITSLTLSGQNSDLDLNSQKIINLATPAADTDAATKAYVDSVAQGLDVKDSVVAATTASFTTTQTGSTDTIILTNGEGGFSTAGAGSLTIDGVSLSQGDRVLIKDGVNENNTGVSQAKNGIYTVPPLGGALCTLTRSSDMDSTSGVTAGSFFFVEQGSNNADVGFVITNDGSITIGTTNIAFSQFSGAGQITAGIGLAKSGNELSVNVDGTSLEINVDDLRVKAGGIDDSHLHASVITGQTEATGVEADDLILVYDDDASALRKMKRSTFVAGLGSSSNTFSDHVLPGSANTYDLGSTTAEWRHLFLSDDGSIKFGGDQDVVLYHDHNDGLKLAMTSDTISDPTFEINSQYSGNHGGPYIKLNLDSPTPAANDIIGGIKFYGNDTNGTSREFGKIVCQTADISTAGNHVSRISIGIQDGNHLGSSPVGLHVEGVSGGGKAKVNVQPHNGTDSGLHLGGTLVTSLASELNALDVSSKNPSDNEVLTYTAASGLHWAAAGGGGGSAPAVTSLSPVGNLTSSDFTSTGIEEIFLITPNQAITAGLPSAATVGSGYKYQIKNLSAYTITLDPDSSETIDGSATFDISTQYSSVTIVSNGSNWFII